MIPGEGKVKLLIQNNELKATTRRFLITFEQTTAGGGSLPARRTHHTGASEVLICKHTSKQFALKTIQKASHNEHSIRTLYLKIKQTFSARV